MNDNQEEFGHDQIEPSRLTAGSGADWRTTWTPSRRHFLSLTGLALGSAALGFGVSACGTAQTGSSAGQAKGRAGAAGETMFVAGFQWGPPKSFNPLAAQPDWPTNVQAGN
jgi:peptide/nickel transport system substrate-binding protein